MEQGGFFMMAALLFPIIDCGIKWHKNLYSQTARMLSACETIGLTL